MKVIELESATFKNLSSILGPEINGVRNYLLFIEYEIMAFKKIPSPEEVKANADSPYSYGHCNGHNCTEIGIAFQLVQS